MRHSGWVPLDLVGIDRVPYDPRVLSLCRHLSEGGTVPPVHIQMVPNGRFRILDGRHRWVAHRLLQRNVIFARWGTL